MAEIKLKREYGHDDDYEDYGVVDQETGDRTESKGGTKKKVNMEFN